MTQAFPREARWDDFSRRVDHPTHPQDWRKKRDRTYEGYEYIGAKSGYYRAPRVTEQAEPGEGGVRGVYVIQAQLSKAIKIGWSTNVYLRRDQLQIGSPERLEIVRILDLGKDSERVLHELCHEHRLHGEWFAETALEALLVYPDTSSGCTNTKSVSASGQL